VERWHSRIVQTGRRIDDRVEAVVPHHADVFQPRHVRPSVNNNAERVRQATRVMATVGGADTIVPWFDRPPPPRTRRALPFDSSLRPRLRPKSLWTSPAVDHTTVPINLVVYTP